MTDLATQVLAACRARGWRIATAESCTGGLIAGALTAIAGSSDVVECGYVTYSNAAKARMLGIDPLLIETHGAVSEAVAAAMAAGARQQSGTHLAVSVTGIAGPGGGSAAKPVGTVWFGLASPGAGLQTRQAVFPGDRESVRQATVAQALTMLLLAAA